MSAGLEIRGKSMRIWMKPISTEPPIKETLNWSFTPENVEKAKKLAELIKLEIELDQFNLAKHFPHSKHLKKNQMSYYITQYIEMIRWEVAPSTFDGYNSHIKKHVFPRWAKTHPKDIDTAAVKKWVNELHEYLSPKTIREVVTRLASTHDLWRQENKVPYNGMMISKQESGVGKIDPLIATFNAVALMSMNPEQAEKEYNVYFV
jgi:integrase